MRQFACQFKGSPTPHMQGNVCTNLSLIAPPFILMSSISFDSISRVSYSFIHSSPISPIHTCNFPVLQVGDFGLSKIKRNTLVSGGVRGTLPWMAPELLDGNSNRVSEKVSTVLVTSLSWSFEYIKNEVCNFLIKF